MIRNESRLETTNTAQDTKIKCIRTNTSWETESDTEFYDMTLQYDEVEGAGR